MTGLGRGGRYSGGMKASEIPNDIPKTLYHYTDGFGLQGILGPGSGPLQVVIPDNERSKYVDPDDYTNGKAARFWATDVRYMNDTLELRFGLDIVIECLLEASRDESFASALRKAFAGFAAVFEPDCLFSWPFRCFAVCFCESGDVLSQWRGYAGGVGGFAIGFPREVLSHYSYGIHRMALGNRDDMPSHALLVRVAYGEDAARRQADDLVQGLAAAFAAGKLLTDVDGTPSMTVALRAFHTIAGVKHKAFAEEREWRLLAISERQIVKTRGRAGGLVPYMDVVVNGRLNPNAEHISEQPVRRIVVGPSPDQKAQVAGVHDLLASRGMWGFRDVEVEPSSAPFRS